MKKFKCLISIILILSVIISPFSQLFSSIAYAEEQIFTDIYSDTIVEIEKGNAPILTEEEDSILVPFSSATSPSAIEGQDFIFEESTGTITGYKDGNTPENLVIPTKVNGVAVKHIAKDAFKYSTYGTKINTPLKTLTLPEGLITTGYMSFQGNDLTEVTIPSTLEVLGERTFGLNKKLSTVNFAANSNIKILGVESLYDCAIKNITLPEGLEEIGTRALANNKLTSIQIPNSVKKIGQSAFQLNLIEEFHVPKNIEIFNGGTDSCGLFYRNFNNPEKASSNLRLTKVYDTTGKATAFNTRGIVNPVFVNIKYVNSDTNEEIKQIDNVVGKEFKKIVIGKHPTYGWDVVELGDSDGGYIYNYMTPSDKTELYSKYFTEISLNYFVKNQEVTFSAPEIPGFDAPAEFIKTLSEDINEVIFSYQPLGSVNLTLEGEGLISSVPAGEVATGETVKLTIKAPVGKKISSFSINGTDKIADLSSTGITSNYTFKINENTKAIVEYKDVSYTEEFKIELDKTELKLGEKANFKAFYRDLLVTLPNDDIVWTVDHEDVAVIDINTGEVATLKSGIVVLKGALKNNPEVSDTVTLKINPVKVKVRVEANYETLLEPVEVVVTDLNLSKYNITSKFNSPKAIHAITKALDDHKESTGIDPSNKEHFNAGSAGSFISEIAGYGFGDSYMSGWMYYIDNQYINVGVGDRTILDGEYINLWYIDNYGDNTYVYFESEEYSVEQGEELVLQIVGNGSGMMGESEPNVEGITILNDIVPLEKEDGSYYTTDVEGKVTVKFDTVGKYHISAMKINDSGEMIISRPYAMVNVSAASVSITPREQLEKNLTYLLRTVDNPTFGTGGGEWSVLSLARGEYQVPENYYDIYYNNVVKEIKPLMEKNSGKLHKSKGTEHSRLILGLTSVGKDVTDVGGYNILEAIADYNYMIKQGINGPIFALLALDSHDYEIPQVEGAAIQSTREMFINYLLDNEINKGQDNAGGWALSGKNPDPDITAMAIQGLTPYYNTNTTVKAAVDRAIVWLSSAQTADGGFASWGSVNSESISQVIVALTGLKINPHTDSRFIKNGNSAIGALMTFAVPEGGFMHIKPGEAGNGGAAAGVIDGMATDQGTYALVAYDRLINGKNSLYDMTDVDIEIPEEPEEPSEMEEIELPSGENPVINISEGETSYRIPVKEEDKNKNITINIPGSKEGKVTVELSSNKELPKIKAVKGDISIVIPKGIRIINAANTSIELITSKNISDEVNKVESLLPKDKKLEIINKVFSMGGSEKVEFNDYITITLKGMSGKESAYIQEGKIYAITKYKNDLLGQSSDKDEYAYDFGEDLIIKTKHFTDFIVYSVSKVEDNNNGGGNPGTPVKSYITLSIDKKTIKKGYVLSPTKFEITEGESVWNVLKRVLDDNNIDYDYTFTPKYNSVYVESIDGDGEFDHGTGSGWMYNVNGWYPNYGASLYDLADGDVVQWRYTTNLGVDLGEDITKWDPKINISGIKDNEEVTEEKITVTITAIDGNGKRIVPTVQLNGKKINGSNEKYILELQEGTNKLIATAKDSMDNEVTEELSIKYVKDGSAGGGAANNTGGQNSSSNTASGNLSIYNDESMISSWAKDSIDKATSLGIVQGHNNMFNPKSNITRAEFTKIIVSILNLDVIAEKSIDFSDVNINDWFYPYINAAYKANIVSGMGNEFKPNDNITREQMAVIIVRALGLKTAISNTVLKDSHLISDWARADVEVAIAHGLMVGNGDEFGPKAIATREMATVVAMRAYEYINDTTK